MTGPAGAVFVDAFGSGAGHGILATGGADMLVRLWNTSTRQVAGYICAVAGDPITRAEWAKYLPGVPYHPPCPRQ